MRRRPRGAPVSSETKQAQPIAVEPNFDPSKWLDAIQAAVLLRRFRRKDGQPSVGAIRNLVYRKRLQAHKILGRLMFSRADLECLIATAPIVGGC